MSMGVMNVDKVMKATVPCIMAGIFGIYGLIVAVILKGNIPKLDQNTGNSFTYADGYRMLASGLACGLSSLGAGTCCKSFNVNDFPSFSFCMLVSAIL